MSKQYTLGKTERLKSRKLVEQLFKSGKSFSVYPFRLYYHYDGDLDHPVQAGFGVSARNMKKAVDRNRVKRLMKEGYRLQKTELVTLAVQKKLHLAVFLIYTGKELPDFSLTNEKIGVILKRLVKIMYENDSAPA